MRRETHSLIYPMLIMGLLLIFAGSCKKENSSVVVNGNTFTDSRDGNVYHTVTIGSQVWMLENLRYLPSVVGPATVSLTTPYYYVYDYDGTSVADAKATRNYTTYGVLYNWPAAMNGDSSSTKNPSGVKGICPAGWHLPSEDEWRQLTTYLGGDSIAGDKLKDTGNNHWYDEFYNFPHKATNISGFTALPGGLLGSVNFLKIRSDGFWWSATNSKKYGFDNDVIATRMEYRRSKVSFVVSNAMSFGCSVRCIKD